jgi:syntaxin 16
MSATFKTFGYSKNRTSDFFDFKTEIARRKNNDRFARPASRNSQNDPLWAKGVELEALPTPQGLPPVWVDHYDAIKTNLDKLDSLHRELNSIISKRVTDVFGKNHAKHDSQIKEKNSESMRLLHECEEHLGKISNLKDPKETPADANVRKNIQTALAQKLSEKTMVIRKQQKHLYNKMKEQSGSGKESSNDMFFNNDSTKASADMSPDEISEMEMEEDMGMERDAEINQLVDTMNELGHIFKQLNHLVIDQGNLLDRIDYNIEQTLHNTKKANVQLKKAVKYQDSACARYCIWTLVLMIFVFSVILFLKFRN